MTISNLESLESCVRTGTYSTILSDPQNNNWGIHHEGTFADYYSMKEGDHIYFFNNRKIYGIGRIIDIKKDCKYLNYLGADDPCSYSKESITSGYRFCLMEHHRIDAFVHLSLLHISLCGVLIWMRLLVATLISSKS